MSASSRAISLFINAMRSFNSATDSSVEILSDLVRDFLLRTVVLVDRRHWRHLTKSEPNLAAGREVVTPEYGD